MEDKTAVIKSADMSDEMQQDAVDCAVQVGGRAGAVAGAGRKMRAMVGRETVRGAPPGRLDRSIPCHNPGASVKTEWRYMAELLET